MNDKTKHIGLFAGSFDPFTEGHASIVRRALAFVDSVVIGIGVNPDKHYLYTVDERRDAIERRYAGEERVSVVAYEGLTADLARRLGACCLIKGVRNAADLEYERLQADFNRSHGIETVLLPAEPHLEDVSSTKEREKIRQQNNNPYQS